MVRESKREWENIRRMGTMTRKISGINERRKAVCVCVCERERNKQTITHAKTGEVCRDKGKKERENNMKEKERNRQTQRIRVNFKVYIELAVAAPEDLSRIALASPPWPINVKLSGSREAIRFWKRKTH